jgi:hypothetical protein
MADPRGVSLLPIVVTVTVASALIGPALKGTARPPAAPAARPSVTSSGIGLGLAPVYPGPSVDTPLPPKDLPITYESESHRCGEGG